MDFGSLLMPLLGIGSNLLGTIFGNQTNDSAKKTETVNTTGTTKSGAADSFAGTTSTSNLDDATKSILTTLVQQLLPGVTQGNTAVKNTLSQISGAPFDPQAYVKGIMTAATSNAMGQQESDLNGIAANNGGAADSNSATALLASKIRNQTANNLAGVQAQATGDAQNIVNNHASTVAGLSSQLDQGTTGLLAALQNATSTQKTNQIQTNTTQQAAASKSTTNTSGKSNSTNNDWNSFFKTLGGAFNSNFNTVAGA